MNRRLSLLHSVRGEIATREAKGMQAGKPGDPCWCGCFYEYNGGSSTAANDAANKKGGLHSDYDQYCGDCGDNS